MFYKILWLAIAFMIIIWFITGVVGSIHASYSMEVSGDTVEMEIASDDTVSIASDDMVSLDSVITSIFGWLPGFEIVKWGE